MRCEAVSARFCRTFQRSAPRKSRLFLTIFSTGKSLMSDRKLPSAKMGIRIRGSEGRVGGDWRSERDRGKNNQEARNPGKRGRLALRGFPREELRVSFPPLIRLERARCARQGGAGRISLSERLSEVLDLRQLGGRRRNADIRSAFGTPIEREPSAYLKRADLFPAVVRRS